MVRLLDENYYGLGFYEGDKHEYVPQRNQRGVNNSHSNFVPGVSVMGNHVRNQFYGANCEPFYPLKVQAQAKLRELRRMKKPNLP